MHTTYHLSHLALLQAVWLASPALYAADVTFRDFQSDPLGQIQSIPRTTESDSATLGRQFALCTAESTGTTTTRFDVIDANSPTPDPFGGAGNRSLLIENLSTGSNGWYDQAGYFADAIPKGTFSVDFAHSSAGNQDGGGKPLTQFVVGYGHTFSTYGKAIDIIIDFDNRIAITSTTYPRRSASDPLFPNQRVKFLQFPEGGGDAKVLADVANNLAFDFDCVSKNFTFSLNGVPLEESPGDTALPFWNPSGTFTSEINDVYLVAPASERTGRVFLDNIRIAESAPREWAVDSDGNWTTANNWNGGVPNSVGDTALLGANITAPRTVTVDAPITVRGISFNNANSYTVAGSNTLTVQTTGADAIIQVDGGSHTISAPLTLAGKYVNRITGTGSLITGDVVLISETRIEAPTTMGNITNNAINPDTNQTAALIIQSAPLTAGNIDGTGNLVVGGQGLTADRIRLNQVTIGGTATISTGRSPAKTSVIATLDIQTGAKLDLGSNDLVVDGGTTPFATIKAAIISGYDNGSWTGPGIVSSAAFTSGSPKTALGYADNATLGLGTFSGVSVNGSSVLVRYTAAGDANLNGAVDSTDFVTLTGNYGVASGANWVQGDFNYDQKVNTLDFNLLAGNFAAAVPSPSLGSVVPEPATAGVVIAGLALLQRRHRRPPVWTNHPAD